VVPAAQDTIVHLIAASLLKNLALHIVTRSILCHSQVAVIGSRGFLDKRSGLASGPLAHLDATLSKSSTPPLVRLAFTAGLVAIVAGLAQIDIGVTVVQAMGVGAGQEDVAGGFLISQELLSSNLGDIAGRLDVLRGTWQRLASVATSVKTFRGMVVLGVLEGVLLLNRKMLDAVLLPRIGDEDERTAIVLVARNGRIVELSPRVTNLSPLFVLVALSPLAILLGNLLEPVLAVSSASISRC